MRRLLTLALGVSLAALGGTEGAAAAACVDSGRLEGLLAQRVPSLESFSLSNGLRVYLAPRGDERTVSVRVAYDVGARDEAPGRGGVAHLFEHMMFKGSGRVPDGGHFRIVRDAGGRTNATTDYDTTQYWSTVPAAALERVLFAEADRMRSLRLSEANLANQRAAIREEGLGLENLPYVKPATRFGLELFVGTPYGHSPIGTPEELAATTPAEAAAFHARYYTPANAVLVVAGGFAPEQARAAVERHFGSIPRGEPRPRRGPVQLDRRPRHADVVDPLAPFPVYAVVWSTVGARSDDALAVEVLDGLLLGRPDARFTRPIVQPLTLEAYAASVAFRDVGLMNHVFVPRTFVGFDEIQEGIRGQIETLRREGPGVEEHCRSVRRSRASRLARLETSEDVAAAVARGVLFFDDPAAFENELRRLEALGPDEVRRVARSYLVDDFHTLEIRPSGVMRWLKPLLEVLPSAVGRSLEESLL